jgi:hypothetical protein
VQSNRTIPNDKPDVVIHDKQQTCILLDVSIPGDINVIKKEAEKILKYKDLIICRVSQEERTVFWEVIVSVILSKKFYTNMCPIPNSFRDRAILVVWLGRPVLSFPPALLREGRSVFWEVIVSVILSKKTLYEHVSYSERFPR